MAKINFSSKEISCKIVYYGPGMSGKTTNLEVIHDKAPANVIGELTSIATQDDRTLFFDYLPMDVGEIKGMKTSFQIYTVPGQVLYNATRKIVLMGADGIIFVADSQKKKLAHNRISLKNLQENLGEQGRTIESIPVVMQWNKQDLPDALPPEELDRQLNPWGFQSFPASATENEGVFPTFKALSKLVVDYLSKDYGAAASDG